MNELPQEPDLFALKIQKHAAALQGRFYRECRQLEARHRRGLPGQPEAAQRASALAELLVEVYSAPPVMRQRGALLLVTDARLAGNATYSLSLLNSISALDASLQPLYCLEQFLCRTATGEDAEDAWRAIRPCDAVSSLPLVTARIEHLLRRQRLLEAEDFVRQCKPEGLIDAGESEVSAIRAFRALAHLALQQQKHAVAHHYFVKALSLAKQIDSVHCPVSRDLALSLHREHINALASTPAVAPESLMEAHRTCIAALRQVAERDQGPEIKSRVAAALGSFSKCLEQLGYLHEAIEMRKGQLQAIDDIAGGHNPTAAVARERLAALFASLGRKKESRQQLRLAQGIYEDFGEVAKAERVRKALAEGQNDN